jgi:predicted MPP superfamily phosphohydrolase
MILFTGDIVNTHATEMLPWIETFKKNKGAPLREIFSVLGNHDYGEYVSIQSLRKSKTFKVLRT